MTDLMLLAVLQKDAELTAKEIAGLEELNQFVIIYVNIKEYFWNGLRIMNKNFERSLDFV